MNKGIITTAGNENATRLISGLGGMPFEYIVLGTGTEPASKSDRTLHNEITSGGLERKKAEVSTLGDKLEYTGYRECTSQTTVTEIGICNRDGILLYRDTSFQKTYIEGEKITITIIINYV